MRCRRVSGNQNSTQRYEWRERERNNKLNSSYGSDRSIGQFYSREIGGLSLRRYFHLVHFGQCIFIRFVRLYLLILSHTHTNGLFFSACFIERYFVVECRISVFEPFKFNNKEQTVLIWCIRSYLSFHSHLHLWPPFSCSLFSSRCYWFRSVAFFPWCVVVWCWLCVCLCQKTL